MSTARQGRTMRARTKGFLAPLLGAAAVLIVGVALLFNVSDISQTGFQLGAKRLSTPEPGKAVSASGMAVKLANLPLRFEVNQGQAGNDAQYVARGPGYNVLLNGREATLVLDGANQAVQPARRARQERLLDP